MNSTTSGDSTNSTTHYLWTGDLKMSMVCINSLFILPTHSYVLWLIITRNGIVSEIFNFSLSICEIGTCLDSLFFLTSSRFSWLLMLLQFLQGLGVTGRPLFQCLMCVERYLAVVHPVTFLKYKPLRYRVICSAVAWIITLGSCLCCMVISLAQVWFFAMQFLLFLFIELFCCVAVLRSLKQSGPGERKREKEEQNHMKRRAFTLILIYTVSMVIIYAPYTIATLFHVLTQHNVPVLWFVNLICYGLASVTHAVLFLRRGKKLSCIYS